MLELKAKQFECDAFEALRVGRPFAGKPAEAVARPLERRHRGGVGVVPPSGQPGETDRREDQGVGRRWGRRAGGEDKRGGGQRNLALDEEVLLIPKAYAEKVTHLDEALKRLEAVNPRMSQAIEQRYFGGLTLEETAEVLGVSLATTKRDLRFAQAWLAEELGGGIDL